MARARSHHWPHSMWLKGWLLNKQDTTPSGLQPITGITRGDTAMNLVIARDKGMQGRVACGIAIKLKL